MADRLTRIGAVRAAALLATGVSAAWAQTGSLPDPTRPSGMAEQVAGEPAPAPAAGLQAVLMRPGQPPVALINGEVVPLGGRVGDARLIRLGETEAVLQGANGREVLKLAPAAEKKLPAVVKPAMKPRKKTPGRSNRDE